MIYVFGGSGKLGRSIRDVINNAVFLSTSGKYNTKRFSISELPSIVKNASVVINAAGRVNGSEEELMKANVSLVRHLVKHLPKDTLLIQISSISVYGKRMYENPANEATPINPDSTYALSKYLGEVEAKKHKRTVILRLGPLYGRHFNDYFRMFKYLSKGRMPIIGNGNNRIPFTFVNDVLNVIPKLFDFTDGLYVLTGKSESQKTIYSIACKYLGCDTPRVHIPLILAKAFVKLGLLKGFTEEHLNILSSDRVFDNSKAIDELSFKQTPIEDGIRYMVNLYKHNLFKHF